MKWIMMIMGLFFQSNINAQVLYSEDYQRVVLEGDIRFSRFNWEESLRLDVLVEASGDFLDIKCTKDSSKLFFLRLKKEDDKLIVLDGFYRDGEDFYKLKRLVSIEFWDDSYLEAGVPKPKEGVTARYVFEKQKDGRIFMVQRFVKCPCIYAEPAPTINNAN